MHSPSTMHSVYGDYSDRRIQERDQVRCAGTLTLASGEVLPIQVQDASTSGMRILAQRRPEGTRTGRGERVLVRLPLADRFLLLHAIVVWNVELTAGSMMGLFIRTSERQPRRS